LTKEQKKNYVLPPFYKFGRDGRPKPKQGFAMFRAVVEEAAALASLSLFLGMIAIWAQVLSGL
jgi:hypothetical protein